MGLSGQQRRQLQDALIDAFPTTASLEQMLAFGLDKNLRAIAGEGSLQEIVFRLIQVADSKRWVEDLVRAARKENPRNSELAAIAEELFPDQSSSSNLQREVPIISTTRPLDDESQSVSGGDYTRRRETDDDLSSDRNVDYTRLRDLLANGHWKQADEETLAVMLKATGREEEGLLDYNSIENFPYTDLRTIDQLWVKYSLGCFGFSVQKRIWESLGFGLGFFFGLGYFKFTERVGWTSGNSYIYISKNNVTFDTSAHPGHLPWCYCQKITFFWRISPGSVALEWEMRRHLDRFFSRIFWN